VAAVSLDQVRAGAAPAIYPRHVLTDCETGLVLFAAAFHGQQDAVWMADAGITATCIDLDGGKLEEMRAVYPDGWQFVKADAFKYATNANRQWDVVSIDCPSNLFDRCAELLPFWCLLARRAVILGTGTGTVIEPPAGWRVSERLRRSNFQGGCFWTVVEPC
jgi:hypothetical protein